MDEKQRRPADVESRRRKLRLSSATTDTVVAFQQSHHSMAGEYLNEIEIFMTCLFVSRVVVDNSFLLLAIVHRNYHTAPTFP